jgi:hypothetical protein
LWRPLSLETGMDVLETVVQQLTARRGAAGELP